MSAADEGGCTVDPGRARAEEGKKVRVRSSEGTDGRVEAGWRGAPRAASRQRRIVERTTNTATSQKASWTPGNPPTLNGCTENGGPEKERIPFCRAGGDGERHGEEGGGAGGKSEQTRAHAREKDEQIGGLEQGMEVGEGKGRMNVRSERVCERKKWLRRDGEGKILRARTGYKVFRPIS